MNVVDTIRKLVRPVVTFAFVGNILALATFLVVTRSGDELTKDFAVFVLANGALILGMWFQSRINPPTTPTEPQ